MLKFISKLWNKDKPLPPEEEDEKVKIYVTFNGRMYVKPNEYMPRKSIQKKLKIWADMVKNNELPPPAK